MSGEAGIKDICLTLSLFSNGRAELAAQRPLLVPEITSAVAPRSPTPMIISQ